MFFNTLKKGPYRHAGGRHLSSLHSMYPDPVVLLSPDTVKIYGIDEGNQVLITTRKGKISQKAVFGADIDQRVVRLDYVWWFPEKEESILFGQSNSNIDILTDDGEPSGRKMGAQIFSALNVLLQED